MKFLAFFMLFAVTLTARSDAVINWRLDGGNFSRYWFALYSEQCSRAELIARLAFAEASAHRAVLELRGQLIEACWVLTDNGEWVFVVYEDGDRSQHKVSEFERLP
jgi:hypothetical protein